MTPEELAKSERGALEKPALLHLDGWAGTHTVPVTVVPFGETSKRYRIRVDVPTRIGGRGRILLPGDTATVPKTAVTFAPIRPPSSRSKDGG